MAEATGKVAQSAIVALIERMPQWFITISALLILAIIVGVAYVIVTQAFRFARAINRDQHIEELRKNERRLEEELREERIRRGQFHSGLVQLAAVLEEIAATRPSVRRGAGVAATNFPTLRRLLESLCAAMKRDADSTHRCAVWVPKGNERRPMMLSASAGFPPWYEGARELGFDTSIAGRAYIRNRIERCFPVSRDDGFERPADHHPYDALICIPLCFEQSPVGVLSVDGKEAFSEQDELLAMVYSRVAQAIIVEWIVEYLMAIAPGGGAGESAP